MTFHRLPRPHAPARPQPDPSPDEDSPPPATTPKAAHLLDIQLDHLYPGVDYKRGTVYFTLPALQRLTKTPKNAEPYDVAELIATAVTSDHTRFHYNEATLFKHGFNFPNTFVLEEDSRWATPDIAAFLGRTDDPIAPGLLYDRIRAIFTSYVEYDQDQHYDLAALFVMFTYVFRVFRVTGYMHFHGTFQTGKSQNLSILLALCLNAVWSSSMTPAALFRQVAGNPGTLCIDEAETFDSEKGSELRTILLGGYKAGNKAVRAERGPAGNFINKRYETYGPKALGSINPLDPTLGSRSIVIPMKPATRRIATFPFDAPEWTETRNQLYLWAMYHTTDLALSAHTWEHRLRHERAPDLFNRQWEVASQFIILADYIGGPDLSDRLITWFNEYYRKQDADNEVLDKSRLILKILPRLIATAPAHDYDYYPLSSIVAMVENYTEEDQTEWIKPREIRKQLDILGFTTKRAAAGGMIIQIPEAQLRATLTRRKLAPFNEDAAWFTMQQDYQDKPIAPNPLWSTDNADA